MQKNSFQIDDENVFKGQINGSQIDLWKSHGRHQMDYPCFCFSLEEKQLDKNVEISPQFGWLKLK